MGKIAVVSCILGTAFDAVYPAPLANRSFFFSNRKDISNKASEKGWKHIFLDSPLSQDYAISSLQAKYVKFLQFLHEERFEWFNLFDEIIYVDHKFLLTEDHVRFIEKAKQNKILLRKTPKLKKTVWDEVRAAVGQERYRRFMPQTIAYIKEQLRHGCSDKVRICNTGLICFSHKDPDVISFVNHVYSDLVKIGTPECQIIWAMVSQRYPHLIQQLNWEDIPIVWKTPC